MSDLEFESQYEPKRNLNAFKKSAFSAESSDTDMSRFVIKKSGGLIKNDKQAQSFLLLVIILAVLASIFIVSGEADKEADVVPASNPINTTLA